MTLTPEFLAELRELAEAGHARDLCAVVTPEVVIALLDRIAELAEHNKTFGNLLREWLDAPFFPSPIDWHVWVSRFGLRVETALKKHHEPA